MIFYNPCTAYCALSASDNSRVGVATLLHVTNWFCITNQYNHYKNHSAHLLMSKPPVAQPSIWADSRGALSRLMQSVEPTQMECWACSQGELSQLDGNVFHSAPIDVLAFIFFNYDFVFSIICANISGVGIKCGLKWLIFTTIRKIIDDLFGCIE